MVLHDYNPNPTSLKTRAGGFCIEAILGYTMKPYLGEKKPPNICLLSSQFFPFCISRTPIGKMLLCDLHQPSKFSHFYSFSVFCFPLCCLRCRQFSVPWNIRGCSLETPRWQPLHRRAQRSQGIPTFCIPTLCSLYSLPPKNIATSGSPTNLRETSLLHLAVLKLLQADTEERGCVPSDNPMLLIICCLQSASCLCQ